MDINEVSLQSGEIAKQLCEAAKLGKGSIVVVGCSSSEICGDKIGSNSNFEVAKAVFDALCGVFRKKGIYLAAQCCEHLNRAIVIEREALAFCEPVNVVPQPKAGGSFATNAYKAFVNPVVVEHIKADAGIDIGGTLIGMHLKEVAVPLRLEGKSIGCASIIAARTRPKFIGGCRAVYDENLL